MNSVGPNEDGVAVVQDTSDYLGSIHSSKGRSARWVRGLAPEDEENEVATIRAREELAAAEEEHRIEKEKQRAARQAARWLRKPLLLGILYAAVLLLTYRSKEGFDEMMLLDFPESEERVWVLARMRGENAVNFALRVVLPLVLPSGVGAISVAWLCLLLGSAAHHFTALCGVGTALLSLFGLVGQAAVLWLSCGVSEVSERWECDLPFVFYWVCSVVRVGSPLLALWCAGPVLDTARRGHSLKYILALPAAVFTTAVLVTVKNEAPALRLFQLTYEVLLCVWIVFTVVCWNQAPFALVIRELKRHRD